MSAGGSGKIVGGNIFVSYSWNDRDFTQQIIALLKDEGYDPQVDRTDIAPSEAWRGRLSEMIRNSDIFLFILTDDWMRSENCQSEFREASASKKHLIPVVPQPVSEVPDRAIAELNYVYFFNLQPGDGRGFYDGMGDLRRALRHDAEQMRLRRLYEDRARFWRDGNEGVLLGGQLLEAEAWLKKEKAQGGVPEDVRQYIEASQAARAEQLRLEARNRSRLRRLAGFGVLATVAAIAAGLFAFNRLSELSMTQDDGEALVDVASNWSEGKSQLITYTSTIDRETLTKAVAKLDGGYKAVIGIETLPVDDVSRQIARDLSRAHYYNRSDEIGLQLMEQLIASHDTDTLAERAIDHMARALFVCDANGSVDDLRAALESAPASVKSEYRWRAIRDWAGSRQPCDGAEAVVCGFEGACDPEDREIVISEADTDIVVEAERYAPPPVPADPTFKIEEIFLHISDDSQRSAARDVQARLESLGYNVLGIELIAAPEGLNRSVRYNYSGQREEAEYLLTLCTEIAGNLGRNKWADAQSYRLISLEDRYPNLSPRRVEIWF